jgi:hypothetical protein
MQFLSRMIGYFSSDSRAQGGTSSSGRRRSRIALETLENRDLLSIPGVTLQYGNLAITATKSSGNTAKVWIDSTNHNVAVSLNGQSEEFTASQVTSITYKSGANGRDTFVNNTGLTNQDYGYGGGNSFTGGTGYNYIYMFGNNNTLNVQGGVNVAWEGHGSGDVFNNPHHSSLTIYLA